MATKRQQPKRRRATHHEPRRRTDGPPPLYAHWMVDEVGAGVVFGIGPDAQPPVALLGFTCTCQLDGLILDLQRMRNVLVEHGGEAH